MTTHGPSSSTTVASRASVKFISPKRTITVLLVQTPLACAGNAVQGAMVGVDRYNAAVSDAAEREALANTTLALDYVGRELECVFRDEGSMSHEHRDIPRPTH
jgi:hypothetical protein